jgi:hypothetical protein
VTEAIVRSRGTTAGAAMRGHAVPYIVLALPLLNAMVDATTNYFPDGVISPSSVRLGAMLLVTAYLFFRRVPKNITAAAMLVCLTYMLLRSAYTAQPLYSLTGYIKFALGFVAILIGQLYIRSAADLRALCWAITVAAIFVIAQLIVAQVLGVGESLYLDDSFYLGGAMANSLYYLGVSILVVPLLLRGEARWFVRGVVVIAALIGFAFLVVAMKRAALGGVLIGFIVYGLLTPRRSRPIKYATLALIALAALSPVLAPRLLPRLEVRFSESQRLERQGRYQESLVVVNQFINGTPAHAVYGSELFNSAYSLGVRRQLHIDFNIILYGSGAVGLVLYLTVFGAAWQQYRRAFVFLRRRRLAAMKELRAVFFAVAAFGLLVSFSYSLLATGYRSVLFLFLGGVLGYLEHSARHLRMVDLRTARPSRVRNGGNARGAHLAGAGRPLTR